MTKDDRRYCMYCDDFVERLPCERCGHITHSMVPVRDAYLKDCEARWRALEPNEPIA